MEENAHTQLLSGSCGACVSTLGAISFCLVSEFLLVWVGLAQAFGGD